ncbi:MAG: PadR family transcriptional regulator [Propionibacteriaceae bacterium]|jgi:DNA-binding PadR family transcriptional regulator|nr:PadR family transcriptional regulator [Propionibacteriaceae bacterium]
MERDDVLGNLVSELRRGTVVLGVLASLGKPAYGYSLIERLSGAGLSVEANTLYPLLRRLEGQGLLTSSWDTTGAKPRKYYALTDFGGEVLRELTRQWYATQHNLTNILGGN